MSLKELVVICILLSFVGHSDGFCFFHIQCRYSCGYNAVAKCTFVGCLCTPIPGSDESDRKVMKTNRLLD
ncbi:unnamed protein product [Bursaphelenchus xylophilus]|uniref:(pine wood nematode) hypothetical protein n=1 Tax=Bursaphelenchus xylophilus TaxID=6326 RepID=A0A1I7RUS6_BURXY|nr:unnamed protein product [Bursaphelenchus xylophilus]CAG9105504.1 unnamed protein product [Bursaphelenchus xylophilus]